MGGTPERFLFVRLALVPCLILLGLVAQLFVVVLLGSMLNLTALCPLCISWSLSLFRAFQLVNRVLLCLTVFNLTALCRPFLFLFLVCLAFPHRLVKSSND
nr:MAG TPA: hypothetical protein [Caudoviricetes sp.]